MRITGLVGLLVALAGFIPTASYAAGPWPVENDGNSTCHAQGPRNNGADLSVVAFGPQIMLLVTSGRFATEEGTHPVALAFDGGSPMPFNAEGGEASYSVLISPSLYEHLAAAANMQVFADGEVYDFPLAGAAQALDEVLKCAGLGSYAQLMGHGPKAIPGSDWTLFDPMAGTDDCAVSLNQDAVDTTMKFTKNGALMLVAGRGDWAFPPTETGITLQIGDTPPAAMKAGVMTNIVIVVLNEAQTVALKTATSLKWVLPWGGVQANIRGVDTALEALRTCRARRLGAK